MSRVSTVALAFVLSRLLGGRSTEHRDPERPPRPDNRGAPQSADRGTADSGGDARGRHAGSPTDIPAKGWMDIAWRVYAEIGDDRILAVAAGVTFYALLALFPAIGAFVSIYGLFADPGTINEHLASLGGFLPGGAIDVIGDQVKRITGKGTGTLGLALVSGLAISLWSANAGMKAIFDALNVAYGEREKRGFVRLNLQSLAFTLGALVFLAIAVTVVVGVPVILKFVGLGKFGEWLIWLGRWPAMFLVILLALAVLYRYGPSRDKPQWRWVTPGSILAALGWMAFSMLFSWYVGSFGNYNETYGSLGAAIGFLTWVWLSTTIVLVGAELNAEIEHQTKHDTTKGPPQPLGARGAKMADTVGAARA
ncbi:MAG TPA: YihY/virulence factor BrkB family protein [Enterovirga sp.]|jgi:membrane protein|nr:YihY/virulence factor BrkB family protein [Enterovirga sp.]